MKTTHVQSEFELKGEYGSFFRPICNNLHYENGRKHTEVVVDRYQSTILRQLYSEKEQHVPLYFVPASQPFRFVKLEKTGDQTLESYFTRLLQTYNEKEHVHRLVEFILDTYNALRNALVKLSTAGIVYANMHSAHVVIREQEILNTIPFLSNFSDSFFLTDFEPTMRNLPDTAFCLLPETMLASKILKDTTLDLSKTLVDVCNQWRDGLSWLPQTEKTNLANAKLTQMARTVKNKTQIEVLDQLKKKAEKWDVCSLVLMCLQFLSALKFPNVEIIEYKQLFANYIITF